LYALGADTLTVRGPQRRPTVERLAPGTTVVGVRFLPGVAPAMFDATSSELLDAQIDVEHVWGKPGTALAEQLADAPSPAAAGRLLEDEVRRRARDIGDPDPLVRAAAASGRPDRVGVWAADLFISPRQLRRRFVASLGCGPKTFRRIRRFQGFLGLSQLHRDDRSIARVARAAGYSDQAHLTRECVRLTGLTPSAFLAEMRETCGPNHDHEASYAAVRRALSAAAGTA
jgi:AraC-like DNA-binding protein